MPQVLPGRSPTTRTPPPPPPRSRRRRRPVAGPPSRPPGTVPPSEPVVPQERADQSDQSKASPKPSRSASPTVAPLADTEVTLHPEVCAPSAGNGFAYKKKETDLDFIAGKNKIVQKEMLVWLFLVHKSLDFWVPGRPTPHPPLRRALGPTLTSPLVWVLREGH